MSKLGIFILRYTFYNMSIDGGRLTRTAIIIIVDSVESDIRRRNFPLLSYTSAMLAL